MKGEGLRQRESVPMGDDSRIGCGGQIDGDEETCGRVSCGVGDPRTTDRAARAYCGAQAEAARRPVNEPGFLPRVDSSPGMNAGPSIAEEVS
jgi:hypothetical protein